MSAGEILSASVRARVAAFVVVSSSSFHRRFINRDEHMSSYLHSHPNWKCEYSIMLDRQISETSVVHGLSDCANEREDLTDATEKATGPASDVRHIPRTYRAGSDYFFFPPFFLSVLSAHLGRGVGEFVLAKGGGEV